MKLSERRPLGRSGLTLPVLGLGCAQAGGLYRAIDDADARALLDGAWACGLRWFDTAPYYGYSRSERRVGQALAARPRDAFVLSTKVGRLLRPDASVSQGTDGWADPLPFRPVFDYSHDGVLRSFEDSLQRLGLARIDLLLVHDIGERTHGSANALHWDALTRGGGFRALDDLRRCGAVAAIGLGVNEWQVARAALDACDLDCTMLAGRYTLLEQASLSPFLDVCTRRGHGVIVAAPFNSGVLAGGTTFDYAQAPPGVLDRVRALHQACRDFDVPPAAAALQFPLAHPAVVGCVAGAHSADEVRQNVAAFEHAIPPAFWATLRDRALVDADAPLPLQGVPC